MDAIFRNDIIEQESSLFFKHTSLLPAYLRGHVYQMPQEQVSQAVNDIKENSELRLPRNYLNMNQSVFTDMVMKKCFNKCTNFVLEDWIDYDELDCTMKCSLMHKKSFDIMKDVFNNIDI